MTDHGPTDPAADQAGELYTPSAEFAVTQEILAAQLAESRAEAQRALDDLSDLATDEQVREATGFDVASWRAEIDNNED